MKKILVVEDDADTLTVLTEILSETHLVRGTDDGADAWRMVNQDPPDILVTDMSIKGISGPELAVLVKKSYPEIKIVMMSGWIHKLNAMQDQFDAVLKKPINLDMLAGAIND